MSREDSITKLRGPILVLGAGGFIGANLLLTLRRHREDVYGTTRGINDWRLNGVPGQYLLGGDLLPFTNLKQMIFSLNPLTVFNCVAYGAYSFETNYELINQTNFEITSRLLYLLEEMKNDACYVHAGTSSEYGLICDAPRENSELVPNSQYAVSKAAASLQVQYFGKVRRFRCTNLRLYSVYGPLEDSSRLIPNIIAEGLTGKYPPLVNPEVSRDFVHIDDVCDAFINAASNLRVSDYGASFNIGTGKKTTIAEVGEIARKLFDIKTPPEFNSMENRGWDLKEWYSNSALARDAINWEYTIPFEEGLKKTLAWYKSIPDKDRYRKSSKLLKAGRTYSVSVVVACYKDVQAIPVMYRRLKDTLENLGLEYELIFVNDGSPDNSEEVIRELSVKDSTVIGISHSRNFGSQAAFMSGIEVATKNGMVILDGDLQDPPELIADMVTKWREGFDIVYGRRVKREASLIMQGLYKLFYRIFDYFSYIPIPHDAGDFSLLDRRVVRHILRFGERDIFLRGVRAFVGFKHTGVDYVRPARLFGRSTNNLFKNIGWARKGILSFTRTPLDILSVSGILCVAGVAILSAIQILVKLFWPHLSASGITTVLLTIGVFGSINLLAIALIGEYLAKIFEEVKARPLFIRKNLVKDGTITPFPEHFSQSQKI